MSESADDTQFSIEDTKDYFIMLGVQLEKTRVMHEQYLRSYQEKFLNAEFSAEDTKKNFKETKSYNAIGVILHTQDMSGASDLSMNYLKTADVELSLAALDDFTINALQREHLYKKQIDLSKPIYDALIHTYRKDALDYMIKLSDEEDLQPVINAATEVMTSIKIYHFRKMMAELRGDSRFLTSPIELQKIYGRKDAPDSP